MLRAALAYPPIPLMQDDRQGKRLRIAQVLFRDHFDHQRRIMQPACIVRHRRFSILGPGRWQGHGKLEMQKAQDL